MAAPVDAARVGTNVSTAGTSHAINVGSPVFGTLLIVLVRFGGAPGAVTFTGYTQLASDASDASDDQTMVFYRWADGTEGATDTLTTGNSVKSAAICWGVTGADHPTVSAPVISTVAIATTVANTADPGSVVPAGQPRDALYIAMMGIDGASKAPTVAPSGYTNLTTQVSTGGTAATNVAVGGASKGATASASDNPAVFTHPAANSGVTAFTVVIRATTGVALTLGAVDGLADTMALAESFDSSIPYTLSLADVVGFGGLLPSASLFPGPLVFPIDTDQLDVSVGSGVAYTITPSDTMALADALAFVATYDLTATDAVALVDAFAVDDTLALADTVALVDVPTIGMAIDLQLSDTVALVELFDAISVIPLDLVDVVALADAITTMDFGLGLADTVALVDSLFIDLPTAWTLDLADTVTLADSGLTDVWALGLDLADVVPLVDLYDTAQSYVFTLTDTVALVDLLDTVIPIVLSLSDSLTLADSFDAQGERQWLIPVPEGSLGDVAVTEKVLVLTVSAAGAPNLAPVGGDVPIADDLPETILVLAPSSEGDH